MNAYDDAPDDMDLHLPRRTRGLDDADVAGLLRGAAPADRPDLAGAAALAQALRDLPEAPRPRGALAALLRDGFDPTAVSAAPDVPSVSRRTSGRRAVLGVAGLSLAAKALLGTGVAFAGVAAAAGGGVLGEAANDGFTRIVQLVTPDSTQPAPPGGQLGPDAPQPGDADDPPSDRDEERPAVQTPSSPSSNDDRGLDDADDNDAPTAGNTPEDESAGDPGDEAPAGDTPGDESTDDTPVDDIPADDPPGDATADDTPGDESAADEPASAPAGREAPHTGAPRGDTDDDPAPAGTDIDDAAAAAEEDSPQAD